jgi:hypothetical protein
MSLVQTIIVKPSTHFDTIAAAALASGLAMVHADLSSDPWSAWLSGSFTKSVRRVKRPIELERIRALGLTSTEIAVGDAVALSFVPAHHEHSPPAISRLQVSGLDLARESDRFQRPGAVTPHIEINADVSMSTGKTAAQVAHALGAWLLAQPLSTRWAWAGAPGLNIGEVGFADYAAQGPDDASIITIVDNGLTEIAPGTATARVYLDLLV